jgi:hypothetical protein
LEVKNPIDAARLGLFSKADQREFQRQCDMADGGCNDAELIDEMRRSGTLKSLDPGQRPSITITSTVDIPDGFKRRNGRIYHNSKINVDVDYYGNIKQNKKPDIYRDWMDRMKRRHV